jgi:hypothetical protein
MFCRPSCPLCSKSGAAYAGRTAKKTRKCKTPRVNSKGNVLSGCAALTIPNVHPEKRTRIDMPAPLVQTNASRPDNTPVPFLFRVMGHEIGASEIATTRTFPTSAAFQRTADLAAGHGSSESTSRQSPTPSALRGRHTRCTDDARTAEFRARNRFPISVSIGHDAVITQPAEISAASITKLKIKLIKLRCGAECQPSP